MSFKTTGLLVVLLVAVFLAWMFMPTGKPDVAAPTDEKPIDSEESVLDPAPDVEDIVQLTIEPAGKPRLVFKRSPKADNPEQMDNWQAVEPLAVPVENYMVTSLARTFVTLRSRTRFEPGDPGAPSESDAGLAPPAAVVTAVDKDGKEYKLEVGQKAAMSSDTYLRIAGSPTIHIVTRDLHTDVKKEFNQYRDKKLSLLAANDVVRVEINTKAGLCLLTRGEDGEWVIDSPVKAYAKGAEVLELARSVSMLRVQEFVDNAPESLATYGLDEPELTIAVTTETKRKLPAESSESESQPAEPRFETVTKTYALAFGGFADLKKEQRYAKLVDQPWVVRVADADVKKLVPDLARLRDPQITRLKSADVSKLVLSADGATATLETVNGAWKGTGDLADVDVAAVTDVLEAFADLSAIDYILEPENLAAYGLDKPRAVLTVTAGGTVAPVTIRVGDLTRSALNAYVLRDGQDTVFVVRAEQANRLVVPPLSLRSRQIFSADERNITSLDITRGPQRHTLVREGAQWKMTTPAGAPVDPAGVRVLIGDLSRLRARRVVGKDDDARFGLDNPAVTVRFTVTETAPPTTQPHQRAGHAARRACSARRLHGERGVRTPR